MKLLEDGDVCPMCVETIGVIDVKNVSVSQLVRGQQEDADEGEDDEEGLEANCHKLGTQSTLRHLRDLHICDS